MTRGNAGRNVKSATLAVLVVVSFDEMCADITDILDCLISVFARADPGIGERDVAAMLEYFESNGRIHKERPV
jgi:hypothetical protein